MFKGNKSDEFRTLESVFVFVRAVCLGRAEEFKVTFSSLSFAGEPGRGDRRPMARQEGHGHCVLNARQRGPPPRQDVDGPARLVRGPSGQLTVQRHLSSLLPSPLSFPVRRTASKRRSAGVRRSSPTTTSAAGPSPRRRARRSCRTDARWPLRWRIAIAVSPPATVARPPIAIRVSLDFLVAGLLPCFVCASFTLDYARLWRRREKELFVNFTPFLRAGPSRNGTAAFYDGSFCIFSTINCTNAEWEKRKKENNSMFLFPRSGE